MNKKRVLLADTLTEVTDALYEQLEKHFVLQICNNGQHFGEAVRRFRPDLVVLDLSLPGTDGLELVKQLRSLPRPPAVIATTYYASPSLQRILWDCGVELLLTKPYYPEALAEHIFGLTEYYDTGADLDRIRRAGISAILMELNMNCRRRGFEYLRTSIEIYLDSPGAGLHKDIYPAVARAHNAGVYAVERGIRQAIGDTWCRRNENAWRRYFHPNQNGIIPRPTNGEMIARLAEIQKQLEDYDRGLVG